MKKLTKTLLIALLGLSATGCNLDFSANNSTSSSSSVSLSPEQQAVQAILDKIVLVNDKREVVDDFEVPSKVIVNNETYNISWTADKTNVVFETVGEVTTAKLTRPEKGEEKVNVKLTATITYNSKEYTKGFRVTVMPKDGSQDVLFNEPTGKVMSWAEYRAAELGATVTFQARVVAYTFDGSFGNGNVFLQDENGGYYAYRLKASESDYSNYLAVGNEIIIEGVKATYNGLWQLGQDTVTGIKVVDRSNVGKKPTPKDVTEIAKTEDGLEPLQSTWVTALGKYKNSDGKHYIQIGANEYQLYNDKKYNQETLDEVNAAIAGFTTGDTIRLTGIVGYHYSAQFYAYEIAKSDETVSVSDEEKAILALNDAQKGLDTSYISNKEVSLYQSEDSTVSVSYSLNAEADTSVFALNNETKKLTVTPTTTESKATLTITVTCGSVTKTADVELTACSELEILTIAEAIAKAQEGGENYTTEKYYVKGTISAYSGKEENAVKYGNFVINDGTDEIVVYGMYTVDGKVRYDAMNTKPVIGDEIIVYGILGTYSGNPQMKNAWLYSLNGVVQEPQVEEPAPDTPTPDTPTGEILTIEQALASADGTSVKVRGIVKSADTWSTQYNNMSVTITDETLTELYIFRLGTQVAVGDDITVTGVMSTYDVTGERQIAQGATAVINSSGNKVPGVGNLEVPENAQTVIAKYAGGTTTNMTANNNAATLGLDSSWTVTAEKNGNNNFPGLNKAGDFRLYGNPSNILTFTYSGGTILSAKVTFTSSSYSTLVVTVGGSAVTGDGGVYTINSNSVVLTNSTATQVRISQIEFVVVPNA